VYPSDSLVPTGDASLLFTGAGMNQFKELFLGKGKREFTRAATCQKCLRTGDVENVGVTAKHHTFFEMLGNFSFGDYFKREAILWAWEYIVDTLGFDPARLCISVYKDDDEALGVWRKDVGVDSSKIYKFGAKENFWPSNAPTDGPNGPCGPCSEIFFDRGESVGCKSPSCAPDCDCDRFVEVWNLVFTQFDRQSDGTLIPLPQRNIDTGMGLERMASVMQGTATNYEIDIILPIIERLCKLTGAEYGRSAQDDRALRLMADHVRAVTFTVADGVSPGNEGRGYVVRRLIRRACLRAHRFGATEPVLYKVVETIVRQMKGPYPELLDSKPHVTEVLKAEEERFGRMLERTIPVVMDKLKEILAGGKPVISGEDAFRFYDTYGLPLEALQEMAQERGVLVDAEGFEREMERQRELARTGSKISSDIFGIANHPAADYAADSEFVGYDQTEVATKVLAVFEAEGDGLEVVLARCPFYGEGGGQIGDVGQLSWKGGSAEVFAVRRPPGVMVPVVRVTKGKLEAGAEVTARVDAEKRADTARNHTATHLLHAALREVLGSHAKQSGSYVSPEGLRFDFSHASALSPDEIRRVEDLVNGWVLENHPVKTV
ncbi:MAG TPA: alanine--tRNA ligase, partial [Candidatus Eisenbacteria bacterium]|nr:alanine--tRNA ligase [Candidatus Eisenbacteria bacterium]